MADQDLKTDVENLKRDVSNINQVLEKLDSRIDKISEVSIGINQIFYMVPNKRQQQKILKLFPKNNRW